MKLIILILSLFVISIISNPQKLEIRNFDISPELLKKGSKVLISFEVFNPGPKDLPQNSFKMEVKINGKLVSLDDDTNPLKSKHKQPYSKEPGKYHFLISEENQIVVEIILTPKNNLISKTEFKRTFQISSK